MNGFGGGRDVSKNSCKKKNIGGVQFSEFVWDKVYAIVQIPGKGLKYTCLERDLCLSGKGLLSYLFLALEYHNNVTWAGTHKPRQ